MKKIVILIMVLSINAFGQVSPDAEFPKNQVPEDIMVYMRNGKSIARFPDPKNVIMNSIGYIRYAENFIYGVEFNSFYSQESKNRMINFQLVTGYRHVWNKRFLPYGSFQFGHASFKNEDKESLPSGDGIAVTLDVGLDVFKIWRVKNSYGVRNTQGIFSNNDMPNSSYTDLYWTVGFVF